MPGQKFVNYHSYIFCGDYFVDIRAISRGVNEVIFVYFKAIIESELAVIIFR